jgi:hypothetical protein
MAYEFREVQFMSASEKIATLRAWIRFLKSGLKADQFTKGLYNHLIQHCSFIAHYSRGGFYSHYFETGDSIALFLSQFDSRGPCLSVEYGGTYWRSGDYEDINRAMIAEAKAFIPSLVDAARRRQESTDIAAASALLARHGIRVDGLEHGATVHRTNESGEPPQESLPHE